MFGRPQEPITMVQQPATYQPLAFRMLSGFRDLDWDRKTMPKGLKKIKKVTFTPQELRVEK